MATSSKWSGHQPFTLAMLGSSPAVVTIKESITYIFLVSSVGSSRGLKIPVSLVRFQEVAPFADIVFNGSTSAFQADCAGSSPVVCSILEVSMINCKRLEHGINEIFQQYEFVNYKDALKYCQAVYQNNADPLEIEKIVKKYIQ